MEIIRSTKTVSAVEEIIYKFVFCQVSVIFLPFVKATAECKKVYKSHQTWVDMGTLN